MRPMSRRRSDAAFQRARKVIPGGVNSPVRAFAGVGGAPVFVSHGYGSKVVDVDGRPYIDYVMSWGPLILGHANPEVVKAVRVAAERGTSFGMPTEAEAELARRICQAVPSMKRVRLVNSGTEAAMAALRVARAATEREGVIKFEGCYHGHADPFLVKGGSGLATLGISSSAGVPDGSVARTIVLPYNNVDALAEVLKRHGRSIAAVIAEPVAANMGVVPPRPEFLAEMRRLCTRHGVLLIFDEVITGFRLRYGAVQDELGVRSDLTLLGKVIGGGLPVGAFGGVASAMDLLAPLGPVYQAGTLSGNPVAVAAGRATLDQLSRKVYQRLDELAKVLATGLIEAAQRRGVEVTINRAGSMLTLFFGAGPVVDYESAARCDAKRYAAFFHAMLAQGILLPPSPFEAWFLSAAHSEEDVEETLRAADAALA
jgi:glutamate-1-semialdehyde 2,1-aminomutase